MNWTKGHTLVVLAVLGGLGTMIVAVPDWHMLVTTKFIGGLLILLSGIGKAMMSDAVQGRTVWSPEEREAQATAAPYVKSATR